MYSLFLITMAIVSVGLPSELPKPHNPKAAVCKDHCPLIIKTTIADIHDKFFYQKWLQYKQATEGPNFNPQKYLLSRLQQIDTMVACESVAFGIQHSIYENPNADQNSIVAKVNPEDSVTYQLMRIVSTDIYGQVALAHAKASKEGKKFDQTGDLLRKILDSFQASVNERLAKATLVYKDAGVYNLSDDSFQQAYDKILVRIQQIESVGGVVTAYINFISPPNPLELGKVRHSILAEINPPHFYLFDMDAPNWIVTWGSGDGKYSNTESLLKNALDYIRIAYLQPNVGNMETALQLVIYSNVTNP